MKDKSYETVFECGNPENGWFGIQVQANPNAARWIRENKIWIQLFAIGIVAGIAYLIYLTL